MRKFYQWMFAAILTTCGAVTLTSCENEVIDNPVQPSQSEERVKFEQQLSFTLEKAVEYQKLETTLYATEVLTEFIEHLDPEALAPQFNSIIGSVLNGLIPVTLDMLGEPDAADALAAMNNTFTNAENDKFFQVDAQKVLGNVRMTFTEGQKTMTYDTDSKDGLVVAYTNPTTQESIEVKFQFDGVDNGVSVFVARLAETIPVAIQFPESIKFTINRTQGGVSGDVLEGIVTLSSPQKKKYISLRNCEWQLGVATDAANADRYELPIAILHHYADGKIESEIGLCINNVTVLSASVNSSGVPYSDEEMENLKELREKGSFFAAFYEVLRLLNSRSGNGQLVVMEDLEFNINVYDVAKGLSAFGSARLEEQPAKEVIDPLTDALNSAFSFTVKQRSTNITAEGTLVTAEVNGRYRPAVALRFAGETDFQVMNDNMSDKDRANYNTLMESFKGLGSQLKKLFYAFDQKRQEFSKVDLF